MAKQTTVQPYDKILFSHNRNALSRHKRTWMHLNCISSVQFSSVAQSRPTLCDPMSRSTPGLPVHHQLLEFTQTHLTAYS